MQLCTADNRRGVKFSSML